MNPTKKSSAIDNLINQVFGINREESITENRCTMCNKPAAQFKDKLSEKEFSISGLCQLCQDKIFS